MYDVMAVAGAVWSCPYAWKGPALVTLGREIMKNKWLGERIGAVKRGFERGFVTLPPPLKNHVPVIWSVFWVLVLMDDLRDIPGLSPAHA